MRWGFCRCGLFRGVRGRRLGGWWGWGCEIGFGSVWVGRGGFVSCGVERGGREVRWGKKRIRTSSKV